MAEKHGSNPFTVNTQQVRIRAVKCYSRERYITPDQVRIDGDEIMPASGDSMAGLDLNNSFLFDNAKNCKVYQSDACVALIKKLDGNGRTMFLYVQQNLKKNNDIIEITPELYKEFSGVSSGKTFYNAIGQMLVHGVLAKHKVHKYWVNPFILFNGDRLEKYPNNVDIVAKVQIK